VLESVQLTVTVRELDTRLSGILRASLKSELTKNRFPSILNNLLTAGRTAKVASAAENSQISRPFAEKVICLLWKAKSTQGFPDRRAST
jgi:hypothetical protein